MLRLISEKILPVVNVAVHHAETIATKYLYEFAVCFVERAPNDFIFEMGDMGQKNFYAMCWRVLLITPPAL